MIISTMQQFNYNSTTAYFNKICDMIEATTKFTTIFRGDNIYQTINYGLKAVYKLNTSVGNRYLHIQSNNENKPTFPVTGSDNYFNPLLINTNFISCYVSPFYTAAGNPGGNYISTGVTGAVSSNNMNHLSVLETSGNSNAYFFNNNNSINVVSFFKQRFYGQISIRFDDVTGLLVCTGTANGNTFPTSGVPVPNDRLKKGLLFKTITYFYSPPVGANNMSTFIDEQSVYTLNQNYIDIHYSTIFGLFYNNATRNKLVNKTTNLAVTAPVILNNMKHVFDDIHYISMKFLKPQEIFYIGEQEYIAFPVDSMEDPTNLGYVIGYCFRVK